MIFRQLRRRALRIAVAFRVESARTALIDYIDEFGDQLRTAIASRAHASATRHTIAAARLYVSTASMSCVAA